MSNNTIFIENEENIRAWDGNAGPSLPDGEYPFEIVEARADMARTGAPVIFTRFRVFEGEFEGTDFQKRYVIKSDKDAAVGRTIHFLRVCGLEKTSQGGYDLNELVGRRIYGTIQRRDRPMVNQATGETEMRTMSDLMNERAYDDANGAGYAEAPAQQPAASAPAGRRAVGSGAKNGAAAARR